MSTETYEAFKKNLPSEFARMARRDSDRHGVTNKISCGDLWIEWTNTGLLLSPAAARLIGEQVDRARADLP